MFSYIFDADYKFGGLPQLELKHIDGPVDIFGVRFDPIILIHGETQIYGYRFGSAAYLTDHSEIPESSLHQLENLDILFLDALRHKPHPTHSTVKNSLSIVDRLKPKRAFFTHICHDLGHEATNEMLPRNVRLVLVASGKTKAKAIAQAVEGSVTSMVTASALQLHRDATVIVDEAAAAALTMRDYYEFIYAAKPAAPRA